MNQISKRFSFRCFFHGFQLPSPLSNEKEKLRHQTYNHKTQTIRALFLHAGTLLLEGGISLALPCTTQLGGVGHSVEESLISIDLENGFTTAASKEGVTLLGDLDGDGIQDIANRSAYTEGVEIFFMNRDGTVGDETRFGLGGLGGFGGNVAAFDQFGYGLAGLGDLDLDGVLDVAVGAPMASFTGREGAVWIVFLNSDGSVKSETCITEGMGGFIGPLRYEDEFGRSICCLGDLDGDGVQDIAVGASQKDWTSPTSDEGAVWILFLNRDGTVKSEQQIGIDTGGFTGALGTGDLFGVGIDQLGDLDGDGVVDLVVGASQDDFSATGSGSKGALWILFLKTDGTVKSSAKIDDSTGGFSGIIDTGDFLGSSVANIGDIDGDGVVDIAAGATGDDDGACHQGAVWILLMNSDGTVKGEQKISDTEGSFMGELYSSGSRMGFASAGIGDLDGDGVPDLATTSFTFSSDGNDLLVPGLWIISLDNGLVSATYPYGSGINPAGSVTVQSGRPFTGSTVQIGLDNPLGTQGAGSNVFFFLSLAPDPNFPSGTSVTNLGMVAPGSPGELLVSILPSDLLAPVLAGPAWNGAGMPSLVDVAVPPDNNLIGLSIYGQGLLIDPSATFGIKLGLTDAVEFRIGS